jgi:2-oxoglutarate dehydrogenase complex dehydrogenase (E1) component-like enzyme
MFLKQIRIGVWASILLMDHCSRRIQCSYLRSRRRAWNFFLTVAVVKVEDSEEEVTLINSLEGSKGSLISITLLSEYGVLGFDYGYALASPNTLTMGSAVWRFLMVPNYD